MRIIVQRVSSAGVSVGERLVASIGPGALALVGIGQGDEPDRIRAQASRLANLRIFADDAGKMNLSLLDTGGEVLVVSQFTLYGDTSRGRRPSFIQAADPQAAEPLVELFRTELERLGLTAKAGEFGAHMTVNLVNVGPVTVILEA